jgi:hypothetical protein
MDERSDGEKEYDDEHEFDECLCGHPAGSHYRSERTDGPCTRCWCMYFTQRAEAET